MVPCIPGETETYRLGDEKGKETRQASLLNRVPWRPRRAPKAGWTNPGAAGAGRATPANITLETRSVPPREQVRADTLAEEMLPESGHTSGGDRASC